MYKYFAFLLISLMFSSCKTDFNISGDYEEVAVVHFLLDPNDSIHYMKLNKTFLGEGNATLFAQVADSSYFQQVEAKVQEVVNGVVEREWTLGDTTIDNKEEGAFYYPEQKLYYFAAEDLNENAVFRLLVNIENGKHIITGETEMVNGFQLTAPLQNTPLNFAEANVSLNGYRNQAIRFSKGNAAVFNVTLIFRYKEITASGSSIKELKWNIDDLKATEAPTTEAVVFARGEAFYEFLSNRIPVDNNVIRREIENAEIQVTAGTEALNTYILVNQPSTSLSQNKPEFTNIEGGMGIFSTRTTRTIFKQDYMPPNQRAFNANSTRELCQGPYTVSLGFCSSLSIDEAQGYSFVCP